MCVKCCRGKQLPKNSPVCVLFDLLTIVLVRALTSLGFGGGAAAEAFKEPATTTPLQGLTCRPPWVLIGNATAHMTAALSQAQCRGAR